MRIRGPWERPAIVPDLDAVLKDPGKAVEAVKEIGRQLQSKGVIDEQTKARAKRAAAELPEALSTPQRAVIAAFPLDATGTRA